RDLGKPVTRRKIRFARRGHRQRCCERDGHSLERLTVVRKPRARLRDRLGGWVLQEDVHIQQIADMQEWRFERRRILHLEGLASVWLLGMLAMRTEDERRRIRCL